METPCQHKRGSFLKLVDTIASEIGEFRQEMVQTDLAIDRKPGSAANESSEKDMGNASLEKRESKAFSRDSGYDSFSHKLSILDKLLHTHPVWLQLGLSENETRDILQSQPPGTFLVRKSMKLQRKVISLRLPKEAETSLKEYSIKESSYTFSVEGSGISFADLFRLIAFHCISRSQASRVEETLHNLDVRHSLKFHIDYTEEFSITPRFWVMYGGDAPRRQASKPYMSC